MVQSATTVQPNARAVIGTLNNPKGIEPDWFLERWSKQPGVVYVTGQLEKGESGTPHIQYYVQLKDKQRMSWFKKVCPHSHY